MHHTFNLVGILWFHIFPGLCSFYFFKWYLWRSTSPGETKLLSSEIYEILQSAGNEESEQAEAAASSCKRKAHFFLGSNNKRAKTVVLHIDGLDDPVSAQTQKENQRPCWRSCAPVLPSPARSCQCSLAARTRHLDGRGRGGWVVNVSHWTAGRR